MIKKLFVSLLASIVYLAGITMFHNISIVSQAGFSNENEKGVARHAAHEYNGEAVSENIEVQYGEEAERASKSSLTKCIDTITQALKALPSEHVAGLKKLTLSFDPLARRGLAGGNRMIVRCVNLSEKELMAVVVHEMGHIVDTGSNLRGTRSAGKSKFRDGNISIYKNDPSVDFYKIAFEPNNKRKKTMRVTDFVSKYAKTDQFEDFAETYTYYILHGNAFRKLAKTNWALAQKYQFMKEKVFNGKEYGIKEERVRFYQRYYDITQVNYEQREFLSI